MESLEIVPVKVEVKVESQDASEEAPGELAPRELVFTEHMSIKVEVEYTGQEQVESETDAPSKNETAHSENQTVVHETMTKPRAKLSRKNSHLSDEEKRRYRREQKKLSIRRARAKMTQEALEERRKRDRENYYKKKTKGLIRTIRDLEPCQQLEVRKIWREKAAKKREKQHLKHVLNGDYDYVV